MTSSHSSYDDVPYGNLAFAQTHPDRLATVGRLFGLPTVAVERCRVLELGCASGGNLVPMAVNLPNAEFVGIDLAARHVDAATTTIEALGLANLRIHQGSIADVDTEWGVFDYIICHGVFSWVDPEVQRAIFRIAKDNLAPGGVAYVSYNTYPGWHMRESVRHMMRYHAGRFDEIPEQIEQARALLDFLGSAVDQGGAYGQLLARELERLRDSPDSYLYHEHLEPTNAPLYFHQFIERAEGMGLQYLAEADVSDMLASVLGESVATTLEEISPDLLHLEQYMDFVRNRLFRQTLLCHAELTPQRALRPQVLHGLLLSSRAVAEGPPDLASDQPATFHNGAQHAQVKGPASKAAFTLLSEAWPRAIDAEELREQALARAASYLPKGSKREARGSMMADLLRAVMYGMIRMHTAQPACANVVSEKPTSHPLVAYQLGTGDVVVNVHHEMIRVEPLGVEVLKLSDGQRSRVEILDGLVARALSGAFTVASAGSPVVEEASVRAVLERELERTLTTLTRSALLVA